MKRQSNLLWPVQVVGKERFTRKVKDSQGREVETSAYRYQVTPVEEVEKFTDINNIFEFLIWTSEVNYDVKPFTIYIAEVEPGKVNTEGQSGWVDSRIKFIKFKDVKELDSRLLF